MYFNLFEWQSKFYFCSVDPLVQDVRSNQSTSKNPHYASNLSKLDASLHKTCIKVLRFDMCTSMISLSKIAHQMCCDHPFSHRNKTTENRVGTGFPTGVENMGGAPLISNGDVWVGGYREGEGVGQTFKNGG